MLNKDNENYRMNIGTSPKYGNVHRPMVKHGYHNRQDNQSRSVHRELTNNSRHNQNNQKKYDNYSDDSYDGKHNDQRRYYDNHNNHNRDKTARIGVLRVVNDGKHDQRKYDNYDHRNQNRYANAGMNQTVNDGRYDNQRRYDNYENHNRPDIQNRRGNQSRRDNYNRYDKQDREDNQFKRSIQRQNNASRSEFVQRQNFDPIPAHTWRVVCDSMLGGLSSKLRMCGINCIHVLFDQGGDDSARLAMRENRILLTRNKSYERVRSVLYMYITVSTDLV